MPNAAPILLVVSKPWSDQVLQRFIEAGASATVVAPADLTTNARTSLRTRALAVIGPTDPPEAATIAAAELRALGFTGTAVLLVDGPLPPPNRRPPGIDAVLALPVAPATIEALVASTKIQVRHTGGSRQSGDRLLRAV